MTDYRFFDARCKLGRHMRVAPGDPHTAADLLAEMDHLGIAEALVLDCLSVESSPQPGNPRIVETVCDHPRLHPAWVVQPPGTDEQPPPDDLVAAMGREHVAAAYILPRQYRFPLTDWCVDELLGPLAAARVPLFISYDEVGPAGEGMDLTDWPEVVALAKRWPELPVVVSEFRIRRGQRTLYRALDACPNLHIELSGYWLHRGVEYLSRTWGSERLIFGSNWPTLGHGLTLATVACAEIDDADKQNIAGDNLRRLIAWSKPRHPDVTPSPAADKLVNWARTGQAPPDVRVYDNHGHIGISSTHYHIPDAELDTIVRELDRFNIEKICVFSLAGVVSDEVHGNDQTIAAVRAHPDRFVGFTLVNPHRGPELMLRELQRCADAGLRGVKLIPSYQGYPEEGPNIDVACQWAHERKQLILNHHWGGPEQMLRLVSTYTGACFFTGHTTTAYANIMAEHANLYVCSCPVLGPRTVESVVEAIGADRFLFGSDLTDLPIAWGLGPILCAHISERAKRMIIGDNLQSLLHRYSLHP